MSYGDVVDQLLPWHVWQVHDEDQDVWTKSKKRRLEGELRCVCVDTSGVDANTLRHGHRNG